MERSWRSSTLVGLLTGPCAAAAPVRPMNATKPAKAPKDFPHPSPRPPSTLCPRSSRVLQDNLKAVVCVDLAPGFVIAHGISRRSPLPRRFTALVTSSPVINARVIAALARAGHHAIATFSLGDAAPKPASPNAPPSSRLRSCLISLHQRLRSSMQEG